METPDVCREFDTAAAERLPDDLDRVVDRVVHLFDGDVSVRPYALAVAVNFLHTAREDPDEVLECLEQPGAKEYLEKLFDVESEFMSFAPRPIGPDIVSNILSERIQKSLNVKHFDKSRLARHAKGEDRGGSDGEGARRVLPNKKMVILYSHPDVVWIRFRLEAPLNDLHRDDCNIVHISDTVYELYVPKTKNCDYTLIMKRLEIEFGADLIFCSELAAFFYDRVLFLSNYIKFMYCSTNPDSAIFDPRTHDELRNANILLTYGLMFLNTNNLTAMPNDTHNPLIAYTGERPKLALSKCSSSHTFLVEGNRAMQSMDMGSDHGVKSNYIEIQSDVELRDACLDRIV